MCSVLQKMIGADVLKNDISIDHRLPARGQPKQIIIRIERRVAKVNLMRKKRLLEDIQDVGKVRITRGYQQSKSKF